jgi:hypothetical protein
VQFAEPVYFTSGIYAAKKHVLKRLVVRRRSNYYRPGLMVRLFCFVA